MSKLTKEWQVVALKGDVKESEIHDSEGQRIGSTETWMAQCIVKDHNSSLNTSSLSDHWMTRAQKGEPGLDIWSVGGAFIGWAPLESVDKIVEAHNKSLSGP